MSALRKARTEPAAFKVDPADLGLKAPCALLVLNGQGCILTANDRFCDLAGRRGEAIIGSRFVEFLAPGSRVLYELKFGPLLLIQGEIAEIALDLEDVQGTRIPVLMNATADRLSPGGFLIRIALIAAKERRDYEGELLAERRRAQSLSDQLNDVLDSTTDAVLAVDRDWHLTFANGHARRLFGAARLGASRPLLGAVEEIAGAAAAAALREAVEGGVPTTCDLYLVDGGRWIDCHVYPGTDGARFFLRDVTERRIAEDNLVKAHAEAAHRASHDALTGLANRAAFTEAVERRLVPGDPFVVAVLDLDRFKPVNDTLGHAIGDALLKAVAERMRVCVRPQDMVARLGGDEFAVLIDMQGTSRDKVVKFATRLREAIAAPYAIEGHDVSIGASIGLSIAPVHGTSFAELYHHADVALYRVKENGRNAVYVFNETLRQELVEQGAIGDDLRKALGTDDVASIFEPVCQLGEAGCVGAVLSLAWSDPRHGRLGISEMQRVACNAGFGHELARYLADVIGTALTGQDRKGFVALPVCQPRMIAHLEAELIAVIRARTLDPRDLRLILLDEVTAIDATVLDSQIGVFRALGFPVDLGGFPGPDCALGILDAFETEAIWTDLDPSSLDATDIRRLAIEVATRREQPVYRRLVPAS